MTLGLFEERDPVVSEPERLAAGAVLMRGLAIAQEGVLLAALEQVVARAPFRHMVTPGGLRMSVAMTNCGALGWVSDSTGYRYDALDPQSGRKWPPMPVAFLRLATDAAARAGFERFVPDSCLVNRYETGARLSLHQDRNESDFGQPIVSVSLGVPAVFLFGGSTRAGRARRVPLEHGDVVVWGGPARLNYHGVLPPKAGQHSALGAHRINLTFRRAG